MACRQVGQLDTPAGEEGAGATKRPSGRSRTRVAKAASISRLVLGVENLDLQPMARAAECASVNVDSVTRHRPG